MRRRSTVGGALEMFSLPLLLPLPLTKLNGRLSRLHSADEDAVLWLTSYGS